MERMRGKALRPEQLSVLLNHDADVYEPGGKLLIKFRRNALSELACNAAYAQLHWMRDRYTSDNRASYAGGTTVMAGNGAGQNLRAKISDCGSAAAELERARHLE